MVKMISIKNECWGTRRVFVMVEKKKKKKTNAFVDHSNPNG